MGLGKSFLRFIGFGSKHIDKGTLKKAKQETLDLVSPEKRARITIRWSSRGPKRDELISKFIPEIKFQFKRCYPDFPISEAKKVTLILITAFNRQEGRGILLSDIIRGNRQNKDLRKLPKDIVNTERLKLILGYLLQRGVIEYI